MKSKSTRPQRSLRNNVGIALALLIALSVLLSACTSPTPTAEPATQVPPPPTVDVALVQTQAAQTVVADLTAAAPVAEETEAASDSGDTAGVPVAILPTPAAGQPSAVAVVNTLLYTGPGTNYVVLGTMLGGRSAVVVGKSEDGAWWALDLPIVTDQDAWVNGIAVNVTNAGDVPVLPTPPVPPTTDIVPPAEGDPQVTTLANAFVRSGPGTSFPAYGVAQANRTPRVIGRTQDEEWYAIRINPELVGVGYGWVDAASVTAQNVEEVPSSDAPSEPEMVSPLPVPEGSPSATAIEFVNVRTGPSTAFPVLGVAQPGSTAEVTGRSQDAQWWQVRIPTTVTPSGLGWVSASWVTTQNTNNVPVVTSPPPPVVTGTPTASGQCRLMSQTPADGTAFAPNTNFTTTWVVMNTGTTTWNTSDFDVMFVGSSSQRMHLGPDVYDLTSQVDPNWTYTVSLGMLAPSATGSYTETWSIVRGSTTVCTFWVTILVR